MKKLLCLILLLASFGASAGGFPAFPGPGGKAVAGGGGGGGGGGSVTYDTSAIGTATSSTTTCAAAITVGAGSNRAVAVSVGSTDATAVVSSVASSVGSPTCTFVTSSKASFTASVAYTMEWWVCVAPSTGAQTITATFNSTTDQCVVGLVSANGVNQVTPAGTAATIGSSGLTSVSNVISTAAGDLAVSATIDVANVAPTVSAGTQRWSATNADFWGVGYAGGTAVASGSSTTITYNIDEDGYAVSGFALKP